MKKYPPYKKGSIEVDDNHSIYYELYGNPKGIPLVYLHGGPGGGFDEKDKRFFNPQVWNVLLFDQRGAGKSTPFCETKHNNTWKLVDDINLLTKKFGFKKFVLFGGSWGSTLSLVYAMTYPKRIRGMVLRGIYTNTQDEQNYIYTNARYFQPLVWNRFMSHVPKKYRGKVGETPHYYQNKIFSKDKEISEKYCYEWTLYELSLLFLHPNLPKLEKILKTDPVAHSLAKIEVHYFVNNCFLEKNFIQRNIKEIAHMPKSTLNIVHAGHSSSEPANSRALKNGVREMERIMRPRYKC